MIDADTTLFGDQGAAAAQFPLAYAEVRIPGIAAPALTGPYAVVLVPMQTTRVGRAVFEGAFPITRSSFLVFDLWADEAHGMRPDIVGGDVGFASIHLVNGRGTVYRFARGNIKDFFDISRPTTRQTLRLPVSAFVYDRDFKANIPEEGDFFAPGIVRVYFDFLRHDTQKITLNLGHLFIATGEAIALPSVQDVTIFERNGQTRMLPKFSTQTPTLSFGVSLSNAGIFLGLEGMVLKLALHQGDRVVQNLDVTLRQEATYFALNTPSIGAYDLVAEVWDAAGQIRAASTWPLVRVRPKEGAPLLDKLGISDEFKYENIAASGGTWDRLVVSLTGLVQNDDGSFRFAHGSDSIPKTRPLVGHQRVLAPFAMPRWLSRRADVTDYYRYGPTVWVVYARMVRWLATEALRCGVTHYETWNESTALGHWNDDFDILMTLHEVTYQAVKSVAPDMVVIGACTHSWVYDHLERFLAEGGATHCDGIALHGYTYQPEEYLDQFGRVTEILETHVPDRPDFGVYITEVGFRTPAFSLADQALYFVIYSLETACRNRFRAMLWFRYTNPRPEITSGYRQASSTGYALVGHEDSYCRPAYMAYRFTDWLFCQCDTFTVSGDGVDRVYTGLRNGAPHLMLSRRKTALQQACPPGWTLTTTEIAGSSTVHEANLYLAREHH